MGRTPNGGKIIAPAHTSRLIAILPAFFISGQVLAAADGLYVWHENYMPPAIIKSALPVSFSPALMQPQIIRPDRPKTAARPQIISRKRTGGKPPAARPHHQPAILASAPAVDVPQPAVAKIESAVTPAPPVHIQHSQESDAVDPALLTAWQSYHNGDFDTASQLYSGVLRKDVQKHNSPNRDALLGMAAVAQQRSQDAIAARYYTEVLALDPRDPNAQAGMSSLLEATGEAGAESRLKLLLAQRPEASALHFALGNHYAGQSRWGDAQQAYFTACALEPENAQYVFNLAVSLDHLGLGKLAVQHYRGALKLDHATNPGFDHAQTQSRLDELLMLP